jgi:transcriptional regulator with XRE-family HTH domain
MNKTPIAESIRAFRNSRHWTQEELAIASGVDGRTIERAENGQSLSVETVRALAATFDTTVDALKNRIEDMQRQLAEFQRKYRRRQNTGATSREPLLEA